MTYNRKWLGMRYIFQAGFLLNTLFRLTCWWAVVWVVWNHALMSFLNFGPIGPLLSFGLGTFMHAISMLLEDREP
jgi:hypothetical protein